MANDKEQQSLAKSESDDSSSDDSIGDVDEIVKKGGRKPATIQKEEMYVKKFDRVRILYRHLFALVVDRCLYCRLHTEYKNNKNYILLYSFME